MTHWFMYVVRARDNSVYCGITTDLYRRILEHNETPKGAKCLRGKLPVKLEYAQWAPTKGAALSMEAEFKSWTKSKKEEFLRRYA
jgi:putative endonuclease